MSASTCGRRKSGRGNRSPATVSFIGAALALGLGLAAGDVPAQSSTPYGRAVKQAETGKKATADSSLTGARSRNLKVDISATVYIVSGKLTSSLEEDVRSYVFPGPKDRGAVRVNVLAEPGKKPTASLQVTPRTDEQLSLLSDALRRSSHGGVASLFGMRVAEMQQVHIRLMPDRKFPLISKDGQVETIMVEERGKYVRKTKLMDQDVFVSLRPVADDKAHALWLRFYDQDRLFDPYPPTSLSQSVSWRFPGNRKVRLGPPEYEFPAVTPAPFGYLKVPPSGQVMLSGVMAIGGESVRQGVPILDMIPVVGEAVFSSKSTVHYKISVYIVLDVHMVR